MVTWLGIVALIAFVLLVPAIGLRLYDIQQGLPLAVWHTYVPRELDAEALDHSTRQGYIDRENKIFDDVRRNVTERLEPEDRVDSNRYFSGAVVYPEHFATDWNRSFILMPAGPDRRRGPAPWFDRLAV